MSGLILPRRKFLAGNGSALSGWIVRVWRHGEQETSHLSDFDLQGGWEVVEAIAFRQPEQIEALS